jgi:hypothetical protein
VAQARYPHNPVDVGNLAGITVKLGALSFKMVIFQMD